MSIIADFLNGHSAKLYSKYVCFYPWFLLFPEEASYAEGGG